MLSQRGGMERPENYGISWYGEKPDSGWLPVFLRGRLCSPSR